MVQGDGTLGVVNTGRKREFLEATARDRPEYREILSLFRALFAHIEGKEDETGLEIRFPDRHREERVAGGLPLIAAESVTVDREGAVRFLAGIVDVLRKESPGGKEGFDRLERSLGDGSLDVASLLRAVLRRETGPLEEAAERLGVPPPLLEFVLEVPLKTALEQAAETVESGRVLGWKEGYCPVCGGRAGMDELAGEEGRRFLSCSTCSFRWPYPRMKCPYCGNEDAESLSYFTAGDEPSRVNVCRKCRRYIKSRDSRKGRADVPLEAEDLATLHLDLLAGREGFERGK
jgi:FdhE protein